MADKPITYQETVDMQKDADTLKQVTSADKNTTVVSRLGREYPSLAKALQTIMDAGGFTPYSTESDLKASVPLVVPSAAYAFDTKKVWLWNGTAWVDEGTSALDQAITFSNATKVEKRVNLLEESKIYEVTDENGNPTWLQVGKGDGGPTDFSGKLIKKTVGLSETLLIGEEELIYLATDENGNPLGFALRKSDGMFADFVINNISNRLNIKNIQYRPKPSDFQILSSIARGVARYSKNTTLPANPTNFTNSTSQNNRLTFPASYNDATPLILVIVFEGRGDTSLDVRSAYAGVTNSGVIYARSVFHGNSYGSPKCMQDAKEIYQKACAIAPIGGVIIVGNSMGGIAALNCVTTETIPNVIGLYLTDPACDLYNRYTEGGRASEINAAYECDSSTYATVTAGYDPMLRNWSEFKGIPTYVIASSLDGVVSYSSNSLALYNKLKDHNDITLVDKASAGHNSADRFDLATLTNFINKCASGAVITSI